jgi:uncharacterized delta-60 repeat protein
MKKEQRTLSLQILLAKTFRRHFLFLLTCCIFNLSFGQTLDSSFGVSGKQVIANVHNYFLTRATASELQPDGKLLVKGTHEGESGDYYAVQFVFRCNADGSYDSSFAINNVDGYMGLSTALQQDGKIIIGGTHEDGHREYYYFVLYRCDTNGTLDSSFTVTENYDAVIKYVGLQSTGKVVASGSLWKTTDTVPGLFARFLSNGAVDSSFGTNGSIYATTSYEKYAGEFKVLPDDKILANYLTSIVRYTGEGAIDNSFATDGVLAFSSDMNILTILTLPDGKILLPIISKQTFPYQNFFYRFNADGSPDATFGTNGKVNVPESYNWSSATFTLQSDGKILSTLSDPWKVARFLSNGTIDASFGTNGIYNIDFTDYDSTPGRYDAAAYSYRMSLITQPDNKVILVSSVFDTYASNQYDWSHPALARFIVDSGGLTNPATRIHFTAIAKQDHVLLKWLVTKQKNIVYYSVQRSDGNTGFKEIGKVIREGNAPVTPYHFKDNAPLTGINYYRIKLIHRDRTFTYSDTAAVNFSPTLSVSITPNPVSNVLQIKGLDATATNKLFIVRLGSGIVKSATAVKQQNYDWNVQDLPDGIYTLIAESKGITTSVKFIKE